MDSARDLIERVAPFTQSRISTGDDHLISGGIKLMIDGSGGARTAWLHDEWLGGCEPAPPGGIMPAHEEERWTTMVEYETASES